MGFNELYLVMIWLLALFFVGLSFINDLYYLWGFISQDNVSIKYVAQFHLFYFLVWTFHFVFGFYLYFYYGSFDILPLKFESVFMIFMTGNILLISPLNGLEAARNLLKTKNQEIYFASNKTFLLFKRFHIYVVLPTLVIGFLLLLPYYQILGMVAICNIILIGGFFYELYQMKHKESKFLSDGS
jgi:hypothetical protein